MARAELDSINNVASAFAEQLLLHSSTDIHGPHHIQLPLARDRQKIAFTLENVLSPVECKRLIDAAENVGYGIAGLGSIGSQGAHTQFRDSARLIVDDVGLAQQLFSRLRPFLPTVREGRRILGLNEQLKFLRYHPGQKFVAHFDGAFCRPNTPNMTKLTVQFYLSHGQVEGGTTNFIGEHAERVVRCTPDAGRALVFQHSILHEGAEVKEGVKYTIRTDVEYGGRTCMAQMQERIGLGGSPIEQRRYLSRLMLPVLIALAALLCIQR